MPIKAHCGNCGATFQAKDSLAGKRVKCPKCSTPIVVGQSQVAGVVAAGKPSAAGVKTVRNPLLDLLDEAQVKTAAKGPLCPNCSSEMKRGAILCLDCGFNTETGERLRRVTQVDDYDEFAGLSESEKMMARAERDIDDMPITAVGQDFGDGGNAAIVALIAGAILAVLVAIGLGIVFTMETMTKTLVNSGAVSFFASLVLVVAMSFWITIVAFKQNVAHGIGCVVTGGLWCVVYGFMQGRQLFVPTIILLFAFVIGIASGVYCFYNGFTPVSPEIRDMR
jgi:hypothetical protein